MNQEIHVIVSSFNNNEIAILLLLILLLVLFKPLRECFVGIIKIFTEFLLKNKIIKAMLFELFLYFSIITFILYIIGFWNLSLFKDSILWFLLSGFVLYKDIIANRNWQDTMKNYLLKVISISAIFEFITNIICLPVWSLLIIIPIICILQLMSSYSENKNEYKNVCILTNSLMTIIGIGILIYTACRLFDNFDILLQEDNLKTFVLPIIYTVAFLPFSLVNKTFAEYYQAYKRLSWRKDIKIPVNLKYVYKIYQFCKLDFEILNKFLFFLTSSNYLNKTTKIDELITEYKNRTTFFEYDSSCVGFEINKILNLFGSIDLKIDDYKNIEYDEGYGNYYGEKLLKMNIRSFDDIIYSATGTNQVIQKVEILYIKNKLTPKDLSKESENLYLTLCKSIHEFCLETKYPTRDILKDKFCFNVCKFKVENKIIALNDQITEHRFSIFVKNPFYSNYYKLNNNPI